MPVRGHETQCKVILNNSTHWQCGMGYLKELYLFMIGSITTNQHGYNSQEIFARL